MGWRWYNDKWMNDNEYNDTRDTENFVALWAFTWCLPIGISAYLFYALFDSQKMAFIGGGIALIVCSIFKDFMDLVLMEWIGIALRWIFNIVLIILFLSFLVFIFNSLPN